MKRTAFLLFFTIFVLVLGTISATASGNITRYEATFHVAENGETTVNTTVQMTFADATDQVTFPIGDGKNGAVAGYNVDKISTDQGTALEITNESGFMGSQSFQISYDLMAPVENDGDQQILTLDLLPPGYGYNIDSLTYSVTLPAEFESVPTYVGGYRDEIVDNYLDLNQTSNTFSGRSLETFLDQDSLTATLVLPAEFLDFHSASGLSSWVALGLVMVLLALATLYWYATLFPFSLPKQHRTQPPEGMGAGDFSYFYTKKPPIFAIEILDLASKGVLTIHRSGHHTVSLSREEADLADLPKVKQKALARMFGNREYCTTKSPGFSVVSRKYGDILNSYWKKATTSKTTGDPRVLKHLSILACGLAALGAASAGLSAGNDRWLWLWFYFILGLILGRLTHNLVLSILQKRWLWVGLGAIAILSLCAIGNGFGGLFTMVMAIFIVVLSNYAMYCGKRKNGVGRKMVAQARDYGQYLSTVTRQELLAELKENDQYFYQILPYAEAVGLGKHLASQLKNVSLAPCPWLVTQDKPPRTATQFRAVALQILEKLDR